MRLESEFYRLPLRFDVDKMIEEISAFPESQWRTHPKGLAGNSSLILVSANGEMNDDFAGSAPMKITPLLARCQYLQQVIASFNTPVSRTRLMRLEGEHTVPIHTDWTYHWFRRIRIHVPIITYPEVRFYCNNNDVNMAGGEAWIFDNFKPHWVVNPINQTRIHLVIDTIGSPEFWELVKFSQQPFSLTKNNPLKEDLHIAYNPEASPEIYLEPYEGHKLLTPDEVDGLLFDLSSEIQQSNISKEKINEIQNTINWYSQEWRHLFALYGHNQSGWHEYQRLIQKLRTCIFSQQSSLDVDNLNNDNRGIAAFWVLTSVFNITNRTIPSRPVSGRIA